jgi:hypothetical protein
MKRKRTALGISIAFILIGFAGASSEIPSAAPPQTFTFPKGAEWTYKGVVRWEQDGKPQQKTLVWKMRIIDRIVRSDGIVAYVIRGHPGDLTFYSPGTKPEEHLYLANRNCVYEIETNGPEEIARVKNNNDNLAGLMNRDNIIYDFPLVEGKKFGDEKWVKSDSIMYCWFVEAQKRIKLTGIKGVETRDAVESRLSLRTSPDVTFISFVPGLGITRLEYCHHGTLSEVDMKLIEYNPGKMEHKTSRPATFI